MRYFTSVDKKNNGKRNVRFDGFKRSFLLQTKNSQTQRNELELLLCMSELI